jgi:hypothetical protein
VPATYKVITAAGLVKAIGAANAAGGSNTIILLAQTSSPYVLTKVNNTTDGATALPVIAAGDTLTILSRGDTIERSSTAPAMRLFAVASGASLTLKGITLEGGLAFGSGVSAEGGAIYSQGTLTLNGVTVQSNVAQGSAGVSGGAGQNAAGGGIYASGGSVTLSGGTLLQDNQALGGSGGTGLTSAPGGPAAVGAVAACTPAAPRSP